MRVWTREFTRAQNEEEKTEAQNWRGQREFSALRCHFQWKNFAMQLGLNGWKFIDTKLIEKIFYTGVWKNWADLK